MYVIPSLFKHCLGSSPGLTLSSLLNFDQALGAFLFTTISFPLLRELTSIQVGSQQSGGHAAIAHEHQKTQFTWSSTHTLGFDLSLHSDIQTKRENRPQAEANCSTPGKQHNHLRALLGVGRRLTHAKEASPVVATTRIRIRNECRPRYL